MADKKGEQESSVPTTSNSWFMFKCFKRYLFYSPFRFFTSKVLKTLPWDNIIQWLREKKVTTALHLSQFEG
jgi:hypothetical protein